MKAAEHVIQLGPEACLYVLESAQHEPAAVAIELACGSHDEPADWLGMAHMLEHLVFRGSTGFSADDGLMAYVQQVGGRVNARTAARQTLFHFEVELEFLLPALERLVDMLRNPLLAPAALISEREVLEQEYRMYCQAPQIQMLHSVGALLGAPHPLQKFFAGNRQTLRVECTSFVADLSSFHRKAYLASPLNIVLSLPAGWAAWQPKVLPLLQTLAGKGRRSLQHAPPTLALAAYTQARLQVPGEQALVLHVVLEREGCGLKPLASRLQQAVQAHGYGRLKTRLQQTLSSTAIEVQVPYAFGGQAVLSVLFRGCSADELDTLRAYWLSWLQQWQAAQQQVATHTYEERAAQHRWQMAKPLQRVQQRLQQLEEGCWQTSLQEVLRQLQQGHAGWVSVSGQDIAGRYHQGLPLAIESYQAQRQVAVGQEQWVVAPALLECWQNPKQHAAHSMSPPGLHRRQPTGWPAEHAACYWGWQVGLANASAAASALQQRLQGWQGDWSWHGVEHQVLTAVGWVFIHVSGPVECLAPAIGQWPDLLQDALPLSVAPAVTNTSGFALRQLLQRLPELLTATQAPLMDSLTLLHVPQTALWLGQQESVAGVPPAMLAGLQLPATAAVQQPFQMDAQGKWYQAKGGLEQSQESLLAVFIPAAGLQEASLYAQLAPLLQGPLQHELRVRRGVCYGVYALPWQHNGRGGLLLASQSATLTAVALLQAMRQVLQQQLAVLQQDVSPVRDALVRWRTRLKQGRLPLNEWAQLYFAAWQQHGFVALPDAWSPLPPAMTDGHIMTALQQLGHTERWHMVSNQPPPCDS